jgi:diguanylate cyclase (GGDEF)-like protein
VIILAQDKRLEMQVVPGSTIGTLTPAQRQARYKRENFTELDMKPWTSPSHPHLFSVDGGSVPLFLSTIAIPEDDLSVTVMQPVAGVASLSRDRAGLFAILMLGGSVVIALVGGSLFFAGSIERRRRYQATRERIEYLANHDVLTGLFSRAVLDQLLSHAMESAKRNHRRMGVLFVDLDQFKEVNDTLGHDVGDLVLQQAANRLRAAVRGVDVIVRQGGDEFIILVYDINTAEDASQVAGKILARLAEPFQVSDQNVAMSASIGIALYPDDGESTSLLLRRADMAMYRAKEAGKADYRFFGEDSPL